MALGLKFIVATPHAGVVAEALFASAVRAIGLTPRQVQVLAAIAAGEARAQAHLAEKCKIDKTTLSDICRRLAKQGLVARSRRPRDTRALVLKLTPKGQAVLRQCEAAVTQAQREAAGVIEQIGRLCRAENV